VGTNNHRRDAEYAERSPCPLRLRGDFYPAFLTLLAFTFLASALNANDYVADNACASCHASKYASYQGVGMAQSMRRPRADVLIEDLRNAKFVHRSSQSHYEMAWKDGKLLFRRYQLDAGGQRINFIEQQVDWILGSGHRSRVYLYRTPSGELYQFPIAWYTQERAWGMAPGYDRADNDGITRGVRRECLFCHNAYPNVPAGSDAHWMPQRFPEALPEGTGCQRCHGPGGDHVRTAMGGGSDAAVRAAIVNPAKLSPALRDAVCFQCHLQPAVELIGVRRFDRGDYSFRPGEALGNYMLHVDIDEPGRAREQRFEINHHAYRLRQSPCFIKGGITCITCHDPHQPLKKDARLANVVSICLGCHTRHTESNDCVRCHMPSRRTQDVVHVVMTDHRIQRRPPPGDPLAPLAERESHIDDLAFLDRAEVPVGILGEVYRAVTVLRAMPRNTAAIDFLNKHLDATPSLVPRLDLIAVQLQQRHFREALDLIGALGDAANGDPRLRDWRGLARIGVGSTSEGLADLRAAMEAEPELPDFRFNYAAILHRTGRDADAIAPLSRAIELRPNFVAARIMRAETLTALGRRNDAIADLRRALAIDPRQSRAYAMLADLLKESGQPAEAQRWLKQRERVVGK
jgi:predicted CXXCH cytochrome family protein